MSALTWIIEKAKEITVDQNQPEYRFEGTIPSRMRSQLLDEIKSHNATYHDGNSNSGYTWQWGNVDFSFRKGAYISTQNHISLMITDYTVYDNNPELWKK